MVAEPVQVSAPNVSPRAMPVILPRAAAIAAGKKLLTGDSILKVLQDWPEVKVQSQSGHSLQRHLDWLKEQGGLEQYDFVLFHLGTCNVNKFDSVHKVVYLFKEFAREFRVFFPGVEFGFSAILPRPRDFHWSGMKVKAINVALQKWCKQEGILCVRTYSPFTYRSKPVYAYFADGIHLSSAGKKALGNYMRQQLSQKWLERTLSEL